MSRGLGCLIWDYEEGILLARWSSSELQKGMVEAGTQILSALLASGQGWQVWNCSWVISNGGGLKCPYPIKEATGPGSAVQMVDEHRAAHAYNNCIIRTFRMG